MSKTSVGKRKYNAPEAFCHAEYVGRKPTEEELAAIRRIKPFKRGFFGILRIFEMLMFDMYSLIGVTLTIDMIFTFPESVEEYGLGGALILLVIMGGLLGVGGVWLFYVNHPDYKRIVRKKLRNGDYSVFDIKLTAAGNVKIINPEYYVGPVAGYSTHTMFTFEYNGMEYGPVGYCGDNKNGTKAILLYFPIKMWYSKKPKDQCVVFIY